MDAAHASPLEEALSHSSQRVAQMASLVGAMAQVALHRRALAEARKAAGNDERAVRALGDQERLLHRQARLSWAPAHDPQWLGHADLLQTAGVWGHAACYASTDPTAASAMRKCEDRLRALHPYAMARYDRLRGDGMNPIDAMRETTPLFARAPNVRVGDPAPQRQALNVSNDRDAEPSAERLYGYQAEPGPSVGEADVPDRGERRGREIVGRLQANARAAGRPQLSPDELTMILDAITNLPYDVIESLTQQPAEVGRTRADVDRSAAQLAAESFPHTAADAVRTSATRRPRHATHSAARVPAPDIEKRHGRSL